MSPAFPMWMDELSDFQRRRFSGAVAAPWEELGRLEARVCQLAVDGLDLREAARCLCQCERGILLSEERRFDEAIAAASDAKPRVHIPQVLAELVEANCELLLGNVFLIRDERAEAAAEHYERAIEAAGPSVPLIRGNAAYNRGICLSLLGDDQGAVKSFELAGDCYLAAGQAHKVPDVLHAIGSTLRNTGRVDDGIARLVQAVELYLEAQDHMGLWRTMDDLSRAYLTKSERHPDKREEWVDEASKLSNLAAYSANEVWKTLKDEERRLTDLSDQLLNHTSTRCSIAVLQESPYALLATLALSKGRIRLVSNQVPDSIRQELPDELGQSLDIGTPQAHFETVVHCISDLAAGRCVALIDQFAVRGELLTAYCIFSQTEKRLGGFVSAPLREEAYDPSRDLRGRQRVGSSVAECCRLLERIETHGRRCHMILGEDPDGLAEHDKAQLSSWAKELAPTRERLGDWFFPSEVLDVLRSKNVEHVMLSIDPAFARVPYYALVGGNGAIVDEPWTLSLLTASTEIVRLADRLRKRGREPAAMQWFGPDANVNANLGGDEEVQHLEQLCEVDVRRETDATLDSALLSLSSGAWLHFRGHGRWTGSVASSGPIFADAEMMTSESCSRVGERPGFLFAAACLTGFGEPVGSELLGSLVNYDQAGLLGAIMTVWPIHGPAASTYTREFYRSLRSTQDAAVALKAAAQHTRAMMPHPYLWAPFVLIGAWRVGHLVAWTKPVSASGI